MTVTPAFSVIVPVYNTMPYLTECLESLVGQSAATGQLEVIAVDDGSTDGSGEELDRFAAANPGLFRVVHQENSGGPANPCNVGLGLASGRYVFFLGSDDYLDPEAVERMVAAADEWQSDVLCCRLVGVGGRWVNQKLFAESAMEVPFPSELLASALSNTKLFRRSLIEEHSLRFPEGLRVGSDQPFTIEAMLRARRVSVLADRPYYFAVRRESADNITYTSTWSARLRDLGAAVRRVAALIPAGEGRDAVLQRHFSGEVATLLRRDLGDLSAAQAAELVAGVKELSDAYLTDRIRARLRPLARKRYGLVEAGDVATLRRLHGAEDRPHVVRLDGSAVHRAPAEFEETVADTVFVVSPDHVASELAAAFGPARLTLDGSILTGSVPTELTDDSTAQVAVTFVNAPNRSSWGVRLQETPSAGPPRTVHAEIRNGWLHFLMDLSVLPRVRPGVVACLRIDLTTADGVYRFPVLSEDTPKEGFARGANELVASLFRDGRGRILIEIERSK